MEAQLETWENPSQSLDILRNEVAQELDLPDKWIDLKTKISRQEQALEIASKAVTAAEENLKKIQQSLATHGINPEPINSSAAEVTPQQMDKTEGGNNSDFYYDPYDEESDGGDDNADGWWANTSPYLVEDDATVESEIEAFLESDKQALKTLLPLLDTFTWKERMAAAQTACFLISTFSQDPLLKLVPVRGNSLSTPLREAMTILEGLSPHRLVEVATRILAADIEDERR